MLMKEERSPRYHGHLPGVETDTRSSTTRRLARSVTRLAEQRQQDVPRARAHRQVSGFHSSAMPEQLPEHGKSFCLDRGVKEPPRHIASPSVC